MAKRARRDYKEMVVIEGNYIVPPEESKNRPIRFREVYAYPPRDDPPPETQSFTFASDAEREEVVQRLRAAGAEGRLTPEALEHRVAQALRTCTREGLPALLEGLPSEAPFKRTATELEEAKGSDSVNDIGAAILFVFIAIICVFAVLSVGYCVIHYLFAGGSNPFGL